VRVEQDSQLRARRGEIGAVAKKQRYKGEKVSGLQEAMGEVRCQIEGAFIKLGETEDAVEGRVGPLERRRRRIGRLGSNQKSQLCRKRWLRRSGEKLRI
jgi:hypothetical protein